MYLSWAVLYEGSSDAAYFNILIPRLIEELALTGTSMLDIPRTPAIHLRRDGPQEVAKEACDAKDAFHLIFIHADTGGRHLAAGIAHRSDAYCEAMRTRCDWRSDRCITIAPNRETEAWILADPEAVLSALGYNGNAASLGLPNDAAAAERLRDPKDTLAQAVRQVRRRRNAPSVHTTYSAIAQRQSFDALRRSASFRLFEGKVRTAMVDLGCL